MIMKWRQVVLIALISLSLSDAKIVADGPWSHNDVHEQYYRVNNGVPYFTYQNTRQRVNSARMIFRGDLDENIYQYENVLLVNQLLSQEAFDILFSERDGRLQYRHFLVAVAQFPAFCGEYANKLWIPNLGSAEQACKRELATLFAHMTYETGDKPDDLDSTGEVDGELLENLSATGLKNMYEKRC